MSAPIKKTPIRGAKNRNYDNTKFLTMQIRDYNDPFYQRMYQRKIKRHKAIKRREFISAVVSYTAGIALLIIFGATWIGMYG